MTSAAARTIVLDFDGTITERDVLDLISRHFGDPQVWDEVGRELAARRIGIDEAIKREVEPVRAPLEEVVAAALDNARVRPGFRELVRFCRERGWPLVVVSSGFHELIDPILEREGVEVDDVWANRLDARPDGWQVLWRDGAACPTCGEPCKRATLKEIAAGGELVFVGDGYSDRCAAESADLVFARRTLAEYLEERDVPYEPFDDFFQVADRLAS